MSAASSESEGDFEDVRHRRGRSQAPCVISASWVMQLALSRIQTANPWEVALPVEQRRRLTWTGTTRFMALDGIVEAFLETDFNPLKCYRTSNRQPIMTNGSANVIDVDAAPEGKRLATVAFFTESFFRTGLTELIRSGPSVLNSIIPGTESTTAEVWASGLDESTDDPTHAVARRVVCPATEGAETAQWLFEAFVALQAPRYSPNGEASHVAECDIAHASMTVGDFVKIESRLYVVSLDGFYVVDLDSPHDPPMPLYNYIVANNKPAVQPDERGQRSTPESSNANASIGDDDGRSATQNPSNANVSNGDDDGDEHMATSTSLDEDRGAGDMQEDDEDSEVYEETPDEPGWHRPLDRRVYRAQLARERAAWKAVHG